MEQHLAASRAEIATLTAVTGPRTIANTVAPYDRACWHLRMAGSQSGVMFMVHPLAAVRDAMQELSQAVSAEGVALSLNREVYAAIAAVDASGEDDATRYYVDPRAARLPSLRRGPRRRHARKNPLALGEVDRAEHELQPHRAGRRAHHHCRRPE